MLPLFPTLWQLACTSVTARAPATWGSQLQSHKQTKNKWAYTSKSFSHFGYPCTFLLEKGANITGRHQEEYSISSHNLTPNEWLLCNLEGCCGCCLSFSFITDKNVESWDHCHFMSQHQARLIGVHCLGHWFCILIYYNAKRRAHTYTNRQRLYKQPISSTRQICAEWTKKD